MRRLLDSNVSVALFENLNLNSIRLIVDCFSIDFDFDETVTL